MTTYDAAWRFARHLPGKANSAHSDGKVFYSYSTAMAIHDEQKPGSVWVNIEKYSVTAGKHQSQLRDALHGAGYRPVEKYIFAKHLLLDTGWSRLEQDDEFQEGVRI